MSLQTLNPAAKLFQVTENSPLFHSPTTLSLSAARGARGWEEDLSEASLPPLLTAASARASSYLSAAAHIYVAVWEEANPVRQAMWRPPFITDSCVYDSVVGFG